MHTKTVDGVPHVWDISANAWIPEAEWDAREVARKAAQVMPKISGYSAAASEDGRVLITKNGEPIARMTPDVAGYLANELALAAHEARRI